MPGDGDRAWIRYVPESFHPTKKVMKCPTCGHHLPVQPSTECDRCGAHFELQYNVLAPGIEADGGGDAE